MTLLDLVGVKEGILIIISAWSLLALVFYVVRIYEDYQIRSLLSMEAQGIGVYVSEADRIKYQRSLPLSKPYTPIEGVRYIPHWYLKEPLSRNVKSKGATLVDIKEHEEYSPKLNSEQLELLGLRLVGETVEPLITNDERNWYIEDF